MLINGKRALAYIVEIDSISPIEGADNIELAHVGGWNVITRKHEYHPGDRAVFFEIDSLLPDVEWSQFLAAKHFKVKTYKLGKFNVVSQGLLLPTSILPDNCDKSLHADVTDVLGVRYYVAEDNERKANKPSDAAKYKAMAARCKKLAKYKWWRWFMKCEWGKRLMFTIFGKSVDKPKRWPDWITKTDEERWANMPWIFDDPHPYVVTEKIDGSSATYFLDLTRHKPEFGVCSRNVRQTYESVDAYRGGRELGTNIYWEMCYKYYIQDAIMRIAKRCDAKRVVVQGEIYGAAIQGNPYKMKERKFAAFNVIVDGKKLDTFRAKCLCDGNKIPFVPIIDDNYVIPKDAEEFRKSADGMSVINPHCRREGLVYRREDTYSSDGIISFKNVSTEYLLKLKD